MYTREATAVNYYAFVYVTFSWLFVDFTRPKTRFGSVVAGQELLNYGGVGEIVWKREQFLSRKWHTTLFLVFKIHRAENKTKGWFIGKDFINSKRLVLSHTVQNYLNNLCCQIMMICVGVGLNILTVLKYQRNVDKLRRWNGLLGGKWGFFYSGKDVNFKLWNHLSVNF